MKKAALTIFLGFLLLGFPLSLCRESSAEETDLIKDIDRVYFERDQGDSVRKGEALCEEALKKENVPKDEIFWRQARYKAWEGNIAAEKNEKFRFFQETEALARKAVEANPANPEGHFWLGVAYGRRGEVQGILKSLSLIEPIKHEMEEVLKINPNHAGAHHLLGVLYRKLPWFKGGSDKKSVEELKKSIELNRSNTLYRIDLAKTYLDMGKKEEALKELKEVAAIEPVFDPVQARIDRSEASSLIEKEST
ncbi:MAG TPA: hypothetical protein VN944_09465 [Nitrospiria bacterium]|nr:hypothetical protein [Nitrospiria bacterium]